MGLAFSKTSSGPPTMNVNVPACAGGIPPETGASRNEAAGAEDLTASRTSRDALASIVDVSRKRMALSLGQPDRRPVEGSRKTFLTAAALGREVMMISCNVSVVHCQQLSAFPYALGGTYIHISRQFPSGCAQPLHLPPPPEQNSSR